MPHDKNGAELKQGDAVIIRGRVAAITSPSPEYCNVSIETDEVMPPARHKMQIALNARQVEKVTLAATEAPAAAAIVPQETPPQELEPQHAA